MYDQRQPYLTDPPYGTYEIVVTVIAITTTLVNTYLLHLYIKWVEHKSAATRILASLTCSDLFTGSVVMPLHLITGMKVIPLSGETKLIYSFSEGLNTFSRYITLSNIMLLSCDRFLLICYPVFRSKHMTNRHVHFIIFLMWSSSLILALIPYCWDKNRLAQSKKDVLIDIVSLTFCLVVPMIIMATVFPKLIYNMYLKRNQRKTFRCRQIELHASFWYIITFVIFLVGWTPIHCVKLLSAFKVKLENFTEICFEMMELLRFLLTITNPVLYTLNTLAFTTAAKHANRCYVYRKARRERKSRMTSHPSAVELR